MSADCLKLTSYFGERDRVEGAFLADALLDAFERRQVAASVLLRGAAGFGLKHHLHTDRLLTLSEDLPVVSVAVDRRERIEAVLEDVQRLRPPGLLTLERARLVGGDPASATPLDQTKLTVYVGRQERVAGTPAFVALCDLLHRRGIAGATALLGVDGTVRGERRRARFFARNADVPMMVIAVGDGERIAGVLPEASELLGEPLATLERVRVCKRDGELLAAPDELPGTDDRGRPLWQKLMVYTSEHAKHGREPLHGALLRRLRESRASGATVLRGVWGFHGDHAPHGDRLLQVRRRVPVVTIVVDRPEAIAQSFAVVDELTQDTGLVTSEMVPALAAQAGDAVRGGLRLARHDP